VTLSSHLLQRLQKLSPPATRDIVVQRDLEVPMRDGAVLLANRWSPRSGGEGLPTALVRCPYGRGGMIATVCARPLAERGFQVLFQSTRGTFGSQGVFDPLRTECQDGLDTLDWVMQQPWFGESIVLVGGSYLGVVQWAVADRAPPAVKAMVPAVTESALTLEFLRADGFSLEVPFTWGVQVAQQGQRFPMLRQALNGKKLQRALRTLPLRDADAVALGHHTDYLQSILVHDADDPFWARADHRAGVADVQLPASLIGGWFDIFLPGQMRDYRVLQDAGRHPRLTVGPWSHLSLESSAVATREALEFALPLARGTQPPRRAPVRLFVMGDDAWRDFPAWPPPGYAPERLHLQPVGVLAPDPPAGGAPDRYRYDPSDPTPAVGGVRMTLPTKTGRVDNTKLEARADVLTYTTDLLDHDVEVIGDVSAEIWFRSSQVSADVFVRVCDVDPRGRSSNVCDGLTRIEDAHRISCATVRLWPTAYRFKRGHRVRLQVSSGAFPRYNRNPGTGEPRAEAITLRVADQEIFHDPEHPSAVILPTRHA
jgi:putative CocE/NonD family hydrolase